MDNNFNNTQNTVLPQNFSQPVLSTLDQEKGIKGTLKKLLKNKKILIAAGIVIFLLLILLVIVIARPKPTPVVDNTPKQVTLRVWSYTENAQHYQKLLDDYHTANPNVTIVFEQREKGDYKSILEQRLLENPSSIGDIFELDSKDILLYGQYLSPAPSSVMTNDDFIKAYYKQPIADNVLSTGIFGIPTGTDGLVMVYNTDIVKTSTIPLYWPDFIRYANTLTVKDPKDNNKNLINGVAASKSSKTLYLDEIAQLLIFQDGQNSFYNSNGLIDLDVNKTQDALNLYYKLTENTPWDEQATDSLAAFEAGNTAFAFVKASDIYDIQTKSPNVKFKTVEMPIISDQIYWSSYTSFVVNASSASTTESWKLLKYLSSEDSVKYLYGSANSFKLPQKPYALKNIVPSLTENQLLSVFGRTAPNMVNWSTPNKAKTSEIFIDLMVSNSSIGQRTVEKLVEDLNNVYSSFP